MLRFLAYIFFHFLTWCVLFLSVVSGLNSNKGTKSDIEIAAERFEPMVQIGSGRVVVTGCKLQAWLEPFAGRLSTSGR
jgi:hypothetical protein